MAELREVSYNQPSAAPVPKVQAVGVSGAITTVAVILAGLFNIELPTSLTDNITQLVAGVVALTTIINFIVAYLKKDKKPAAAVNMIEKSK